MNYQTFEPNTDLSKLVKCYWTLDSPEEKHTKRQTIIPDGCIELIFHYGNLYKQYLEDGSSIIQPRCFVIGQLTRPLEIEPAGETGIFSVRFNPDGFLPFATIPIKEMENKAVSLEKLFGEEGSKIEQAILNADSTHERINHIEAFLLKRLLAIETIDDVIKSTIETILTANGQLSVDELSKQIKVHRRQLERKFSTTIGLSPKQLSKIIRLQVSLKMLLNRQFTSLTALAYEGEYYDQAHFIKDFKEFTGLTPKEFYGENFRMTSLFCGTD
jgi:AraC-like DNA-binding protein